MRILAHKIILHSPVSDKARLADFVEDSLQQGVTLIAIVGPDCDALEDEIDWLIIGDGNAAERFISTTCHPNESLDDVLNFARTFAPDLDNDVQEIRI